MRRCGASGILSAGRTRVVPEYLNDLWCRRLEAGRVKGTTEAGSHRRVMRTDRDRIRET